MHPQLSMLVRKKFKSTQETIGQNPFLFPFFVKFSIKETSFKNSNANRMMKRTKRRLNRSPVLLTKDFSEFRIPGPSHRLFKAFNLYAHISFSLRHMLHLCPLDPLALQERFHSAYCNEGYAVQLHMFEASWF